MALVDVVHKATITTGSQALTTPGTAENLPDVTVPDGYPVTLVAYPNNTGNIYLGKTKAEAESATSRFNGLAAGLAVSLKIQNLNAVWFDADVAAEGVSWIFESDT